MQKVKYTNKIQQKDFKEFGCFPIISQGEDFINGYSNDKKDLFRVKKPVVIFGDHSLILKYIDFDFILGADGVKILEPIDTINTKYLYYFLKANPIKNLGYARHFKELKEIDIKYPKNIRDQQKIAAKLDRLSSQTKKLETAYKNKLNKISELKTSTLEEAFSR